MSKMHTILVILLVKTIVNAEDFSKETKYIDLLPEKDKEAFLEKIARRIFDSVQVNDNKDGLSGEKVPESQLDLNNDFVQKILQEETMNMRRNEPNDTQNIKNDKNDEQDHQLSDNKDDIVDLTFRTGKRGKRNSPEKLSKDSKIVRVTMSENDTGHNTVKMPKIYESDREDIQIKFFRQNHSKYSNESEVTTHSELQGTQIIDLNDEEVELSLKEPEVVSGNIKQGSSNEKKTTVKSQEYDKSLGNTMSDKSERRSFDDHKNEAKSQEENKNSVTDKSLGITMSDNSERGSSNEKIYEAKSQEENKNSVTDKSLGITMSDESERGSLNEKINETKSHENKYSETDKSLGITLSDKSERGSSYEKINAAKSQENKDSETDKSFGISLSDKSERGSSNEKIYEAKSQENNDSETDKSLGITMSDKSEQGSFKEEINETKSHANKYSETDKSLGITLTDKSERGSSNEKINVAKSQENKDNETDKSLGITLSDKSEQGSFKEEINAAKPQENEESETNKILGITQKINESRVRIHDFDNKASKSIDTTIDAIIITSTKTPLNTLSELLLKVNDTKKDRNNSSKIRFQRSHTVNDNINDVSTSVANNLGIDKLNNEVLVDKNTPTNKATNSTHKTVLKNVQVPHTTKTSTSERDVLSNDSTFSTNIAIKSQKIKEASNITEMKIKIDNNTQDKSYDLSHVKEGEAENENITKESIFKSHSKYRITTHKDYIPEKSNFEKPTNLFSLLDVTKTVFKDNIDKQQINIETTTLKTEVLTQASAHLSEKYDKELADAKSIVIGRFLKRENVKNKDKLNQLDHTIISKEKVNHVKPNDKISYSLANDIIKVLRSRVSEENSQEYIQSKEYKMYEVHEDPAEPLKHTRQNPSLGHRDNTFYVPVYNYAPENAYYDPRNRFGPNNENNEEKVIIKDGRDDEHSEDREGISYKNTDNINSILRTQNNNEDKEVLQLFRQFINHRNENQRKFRFGTFQKKRKKVSQYKINMPVVIQYPKFTDIILSPNDYLDVDYYYGKTLRKYKSKEISEHVIVSEEKDTAKEKYISVEKEISKEKEVSDEKAIPSEKLVSKEKGISNEEEISKEKEETEDMNKPEISFVIASDTDYQDKIKSLKNQVRLIRQHFYNNKLFGYIPPWKKTKLKVFSESTNSERSSPGYLRISKNSDAKPVKQTSEKNIAIDYFFGRTSDDPEFKTKATKLVDKSQETNLNKVNRKPNKDKHAKNDEYLYHFERINTKLIAPLPTREHNDPPNTESILRENKNVTDLEAIKQVLSIASESDLLDALEKLLETFTLKHDKQSKVRTETKLNLEPYVLVLGEMVENSGEGLKQYDWLGTTVDVQASLSKLMDLTYTLNRNLTLPNPDLQLLKYAIFLHKTARSMQKDSQRSTLLPRNRHKQKSIIKTSGLLNRIWLYRKLIDITQYDNVITDEDLHEFDEFISNLQFFLYDLHTSIQQIANITKYKNQNWFQNLKDLYLDTNRNKILEALLHISSARLLDLVEESAKNGLEDNFLSFVETHEKQVKTAVDEFDFVLKIIEELRSDR